MTGKGSGRRKEDINKIRNNWDSVFGKKKKKLITEVTIEFTMDGNPRINDMNNQVEKMLKENKITYSTVTKYINAWTDYKNCTIARRSILFNAITNLISNSNNRQKAISYD